MNTVASATLPDDSGNPRPRFTLKFLRANPLRGTGIGLVLLLRLLFGIFFLGGAVLMLSFFAKGGAANTGWTAYPPLSTQAEGNGQDDDVLAHYFELPLGMILAAFAVCAHRSPHHCWQAVRGICRGAMK